MPGFLKSFVDVLFILLLGTMVMLAQSVRLGAIDTTVARLGDEGISPVRADQVQVVVVGDDELVHDGQRWASAGELAARLRPEQPVLLITADRDVRHHRVLEVWFAFRQRQLDVKLGAVPVATQER